MTRYEQGFLTKCAEYGVPKQVAGAMLKRAQGLGSNAANMPVYSSEGSSTWYNPATYTMHPGSYGTAVTHNTDTGQPDFTGIDKIYIPAGKGLYSDGVGAYDAFDPSAERDYVAGRRATDIFPEGSDNANTLKQSLIRAGRLNEKYYRRGTLPHRVKPDMTGIEKLPLTKEQLDLIRQWQNTQAKARGAAKAKATA